MTKLPETKSLVLELSNGWLTIWLNTPQNRNALSTELSSELVSTLESVKDDTSIRGITLRGKGGIFCAGGDLKEFSSIFSAADDAYEKAMASNLKGAELFSLINSMPKVVLAFVEGAAIAGGLGIVCCADVVCVMEDAKFSLTETQIGIVPAQIAPFIVQRFGYTTARRLMLTGARFKGSDAKALGLADAVVANITEFEAYETQLKSSVHRCAPEANAATKAILLESQKRTPEDLRNYAAEIFASRLMSSEGREGITSFIEKRKPSWAE